MDRCCGNSVLGVTMSDEQLKTLAEIDSIGYVCTGCKTVCDIIPESAHIRVDKHSLRQAAREWIKAAEVAIVVQGDKEALAVTQWINHFFNLEMEDNHVN